MISTTILLMFVFVTSTVVNVSINKSFSPINYHYNYFYDSSFLLQNDKKSFKYPFVKVEEINIKKTKLGLFDLLMLYGDNKLQLETIFKDYYLTAPLLYLIYSQLNGFINKIENSPVSEQEAIYNKLTMAINSLFSFKESVTVQQTQMVENGRV